VRGREINRTALIFSVRYLEKHHCEMKIANLAISIEFLKNRGDFHC